MRSLPGGAVHRLRPWALSDKPVPSDNLELSARGQSDLDDQHDYDSVASDEDTDQEPLRSAGATRNNRARVREPSRHPHTLLISWGPSGDEGADWPVSLCRAWTPRTCQTGL